MTKNNPKVGEIYDTDYSTREILEILQYSGKDYVVYRKTSVKYTTESGVHLLPANSSFFSPDHLRPKTETHYVQLRRGKFSGEISSITCKRTFSETDHANHFDLIKEFKVEVPVES